MVHFLRRWLLCLGLTLISLTALLHVLAPETTARRSPIDRLTRPGLFHAKFRWKNVPQRHPVFNYTLPPNGPLASIPSIQAQFEKETYEEQEQRQIRLGAVKEAFQHSWEGYKSNAWLNDEVGPISGVRKNGFGGWGATLVDSLDTLWIMGMKQEFLKAVSALRQLDFTHHSLDTVNVFETTIRFLGCLLSAYDVSGQEHQILLEKAIELGDMLYVAFDTPNRMPVTRWDWKNGALGGKQESDKHSLVAEVGSMTLEFTRLSQLTGDWKYYDAVARVTDLLDSWQSHTKLPGLWPVFVDTKKPDLARDKTFTLGGMADSMYEYLPKQHLMLGGRNDQYRDMYQLAFESAKENLFFRPLNPGNEHILLPGTVTRHSARTGHLDAEGQHLGCFAGGMVALAAKIFNQTQDLETARQLVEGCVWAYESMPSGIMPEAFTAAACVPGKYDGCSWSEDQWYAAISAHYSIRAETHSDAIQQAKELAKDRGLPLGMLSITDARYTLRPEAIESVFVLHRITGDRKLQNKAWSMFQSIVKSTKTKIGYASVLDVKDEKPILLDSMESYWTAETLKYFYLIFSEPDLISLDEYVFNTEAHPFLRPA